MQPLILGAALIKVLAAADVHALVVDADLVEVFPVDCKQHTCNGGVCRGYGYGAMVFWVWGYGYGAMAMRLWL